MVATVPSDRADARDALAGRLFEAAIGAFDLLAVYLGDRLGLYRALAAGPATSGELAERAGIDERYAREWLEHQAVGGIVTVDDPEAAATERRFALPAGHADVLTDPEQLATMAPLARIVVGAARRMPDLLDAYRSGGGVGWADYGADVVEAQGAINRPQFREHVGAWVGALPDVAARLASTDAPGAAEDGATPRILDLACGIGWSSIALADHFPRARVLAVDVDPGSIARAAELVAEHGVADRIEARVADIASEGLGGDGFDLITIFEAVHDMPRPVEVLDAARRLLRPGGAVLIADERVAERFEAPGDEVERVMYGYSLVLCLPNGLADEPSIATGTVLRPAALEAIAREAGFGAFAVLPIEHDVFRFYRLDP